LAYAKDWWLEMPSMQAGINSVGLADRGINTELILKRRAKSSVIVETYGNSAVALRVDGIVNGGDVTEGAEVEGFFLQSGK